MPYTSPSSIINDYNIVGVNDINRTAYATVSALNGVGATNGVWPAANLAIYVPFWVAGPTAVAQLFMSVVTASGNIDMAVYNTSFVKLVSSGSIAAASPMTVADVSDYVLQRGQYYFGMAADNTTLSVRRNAAGAQFLRPLGILMQNTAFPLPATATPIAMGWGVIPIMGFTTSSTAL